MSAARLGCGRHRKTFRRWSIIPPRCRWLPPPVSVPTRSSPRSARGAWARFTARGRFSDFSIISAGGGLRFLLLTTSALCAFAAWIGLLTYWRFARRLPLISLTTTLLHVLLAGPSVRTSVGAMLSVTSAVVAGVILGPLLEVVLAWCDSLRVPVRRRDAQLGHWLRARDAPSLFARREPYPEQVVVPALIGGTR